MTANVWLIILVGAIGTIMLVFVTLFRRRLAQIGKQLVDARRDQVTIVRQVTRLVRRVESVAQQTKKVHRALRAAKGEFGRSTPLLKSISADAKNATVAAEEAQQNLAAIGQDGLSRIKQLDEVVRTFRLAVADSLNALAELTGRIGSGVARLPSRDDLTTDLQAVVSRLADLNTALGSQGHCLADVNTALGSQGHYFADLQTMLDRQQVRLNDIGGAVDAQARGLEDVQSTLAGHGRGVERCTDAVNGVADDLKGISRTADAKREEILGLLHGEFLQLDEVRQLMRAHVSHIDESFNAVQRLLDQIVELEQTFKSPGQIAHGGPRRLTID